MEPRRRQCSEGKPHESHDHDLRSSNGDYNIALATTSRETLGSVLEAWSEETGVDFYELQNY